MTDSPELTSATEPLDSQRSSQSDSSAQQPRRHANSGLLRFARGLARTILFLAIVGITFQYLLTLLARVHIVIELASHFSWHAWCIGCIATFSTMLLRMPWLFRSGLVVTFAISLIVQPWTLLPFSPAQPAGLKNSLRVLSWNVLSVNKSFLEIDSILRSESPDVLVLIEVRPGFIDELNSLQELGYERMVTDPSWRGRGIAVFSRLKETTIERADFGYPTQPAMVLALPRPEKQTPMYLVAMHTFSPMPVSRTPHRDRQIDGFIATASKIDAPICLVGDLNITPWAPVFSRLTAAGFRDSRRAVGNLASWPTDLGWLGIPIDHALYRGECYITDRRVLPLGPGSDHRPIAFTLHY